MVRTRGDAAALADAGHVRINGRRVAASSQQVRVGDVLTVALDRVVRVVEVQGFSSSRGGAVLAERLYREVDSAS